MTFLERLYLPEIAKGMCITFRHFSQNIWSKLMQTVFNRQNRMMTLYYPEQKPVLPEHYRAEHRLMLREDDTVRCTACQLCQTICPSHCIDIEPTECSTPGIEKMPKTFDIDILRCVFCGFCVEACPCDAIRMDTGKFENASLTGPKLVYDLKHLMNNHPEGKGKVSKAIY